MKVYGKVLLSLIGIVGLSLGTPLSQDQPKHPLDREGEDTSNPFARFIFRPPFPGNVGQYPDEGNKSDQVPAPHEKDQDYNHESGKGEASSPPEGITSESDDDEAPYTGMKLGPFTEPHYEHLPDVIKGALHQDHHGHHPRPGVIHVLPRPMHDRPHPPHHEQQPSEEFFEKLLEQISKTVVPVTRNPILELLGDVFKIVRGIYDFIRSVL